MMSYKKLLVIILWLVTLHSLFVGIAMILFPTDWISYFDITPSENRFFITQGGVFHIVMAIAYGMAAYNVKESSMLINFSVIVKFSVTLFLLSYFLFANQFYIIFLSAISDFCMGLIILLLFRKYEIELNA